MRALVIALFLILFGSAPAQALTSDLFDDSEEGPCRSPLDDVPLDETPIDEVVPADAGPCFKFSCTTLNGNVFEGPGYVWMFLAEPIQQAPVSVSISGCRKIIEPIEDLIGDVVSEVTSLLELGVETA